MSKYITAILIKYVLLNYQIVSVIRYHFNSIYNNIRVSQPLHITFMKLLINPYHVYCPIFVYKMERDGRNIADNRLYVARAS